MPRVVVVTNGSHGDVAPYAGLAERLQHAGHQVRLAALGAFAGLAEDAGVAFAPLPGDDPVAVSATTQGQAANRGGATGAAALLGLGADTMRAQLPAMVEAAADAEVVACSLSTLLVAGPIAEARGLPLLVLPLQTSTPTREYGPTPLGGRNLGGWLNHTLTELFGRFATRMFAPLVAELRDTLDLPPVDSPQRRPGYAIDDLTVLHGISPTVVPRPTDWRAGVDIVGYWWPPNPPGWEPPANLVTFLDEGPAPVVVGFGSMGHAHHDRLAGAVGEALERTGHRAVVQRGWAGLDIDAPNVFTVDHVPHAWLYPRAAAVVHHAGAGTTAAGLRAGIPAVPVPVAHDQPFWARRLVALGAAPGAVPVGRLTGRRLADALARAVRAPTHRRHAADVASRLRGEDGAARVDEALRRLELVGAR